MSHIQLQLYSKPSLHNNPPLPGINVSFCLQFSRVLTLKYQLKCHNIRKEKRAIIASALLLI